MRGGTPGSSEAAAPALGEKGLRVLTAAKKRVKLLRQIQIQPIRMNAEECITGRRSVRKYTEQPVPGSLLREIVELARFAPSWKNLQPTRYHIITSAKLIDRLAEEAVSGFKPNARTMRRCQALAVVTVRKKLSGYEKDGSPSTPQGEHWQSFDAGIAAQTFCLAAHCKGVGSVILGIFDEDVIRRLLSLPEDEQVACLIAMGYPLVADKPAPPRRDVSELLNLIEESRDDAISAASPSND